MANIRPKVLHKYPLPLNLVGAPALAPSLISSFHIPAPSQHQAALLLTQRSAALALRVAADFYSGNFAFLRLGATFFQ